MFEKSIQSLGTVPNPLNKIKVVQPQTEAEFCTSTMYGVF